MNPACIFTSPPQPYHKATYKVTPNDTSIVVSQPAQAVAAALNSYVQAASISQRVTHARVCLCVSVNDHENHETFPTIPPHTHTGNQRFLSVHWVHISLRLSSFVVNKIPRYADKNRFSCLDFSSKLFGLYKQFTQLHRILLCRRSYVCIRRYLSISFDVCFSMGENKQRGLKTFKFLAPSTLKLGIPFWTVDAYKFTTVLE